MIRNYLLSIACLALLSGCVSYGYRNGYSDGSYYYSRPSVQYYGGASYGYPYRRYGYGSYGYGYSGYGGSYGYPYYPRYYPQRPLHHGWHHRGNHGGHHGRGHGNNNHGGRGNHGSNGRKPPWRARLSDDHGDMLRRSVRPARAVPGPRRGMVERPVSSDRGHGLGRDRHRHHTP